MGPYTLTDEVGMILAFKILMFSLRKVRHAYHLQWDSMRKVPTSWDKLYGTVLIGLGDTIYYIYRRVLTATSWPTRDPWFRKFMRGSNTRMGVIKK